MMFDPEPQSKWRIIILVTFGLILGGAMLYAALEMSMHLISGK